VLFAAATLELVSDWLKPIVAVVLLTVLWIWEGLLPFFERGTGRVRHAGHNLAIAVLNAIVLGVVFGTATVGVARWTSEHGLGLLHAVELPGAVRLLAAILFLDAWLYIWHRANHRIPLLWRFHRMHHADRDMDVTTATRFHLGEHVGASVLRLGWIPLLGLRIPEIIVYETLVVAITMFHHANISVGRWDRPLRWLVVTPYMHKVHHSRLGVETDSNYSTLFSFWDRLFRSFRMRDDCSNIRLGLDEFLDPTWQTFGGMLRTPFGNPRESARDRHASGGASGQGATMP